MTKGAWSDTDIIEVSYISSSSLKLYHVRESWKYESEDKAINFEKWQWVW